MALKRPTHSIDAEMVYISRKDKAWNSDRIEAEAAELGNTLEAGLKAHPVWHWLDGEYRFDISAEMPLGDSTVAAEEYLEGEPSIGLFIFRRIPIKERGRLQARWDRMIRRANESGDTQIDEVEFFSFCYDAFRLGVAKLEGGPAPFEAPPGRAVPDSKIDALEPHGGESLIKEVGYAAFVASKKLTESEKKR